MSALYDVATPQAVQSTEENNDAAQLLYIL